ncbi:hypothetical protein ANN_24669 [Periplaneta americana]|uniref:Histone-lysine N-methyltransferase SETMAR n=1 Tax=Periplaneta americana TaxID=6978 RepID=A0ABQ8S3P4_PERAM|nr:hypothetical protein ANN_24669 [Periplaneta americana]
MHGILLVEFAKHGTTVNAAAYIQTLVQLRCTLRDKRYNISANDVRLLHDNARPHVAVSVYDKINTFGWEVLQHPPYSPDFGPSDFHPFGLMKKFLASHRFATDAKCNQLSADGYTPTEQTFMNRVTELDEESINLEDDDPNDSTVLFPETDQQDESLASVNAIIRRIINETADFRNMKFASRLIPPRKMWLEPVMEVPRELERQYEEEFEADSPSEDSDSNY